MQETILDIALAEFGVAEIKGQVDNPRVLQYFNDIGFNGAQLKDETAWCSAFANWVVQRAGGFISGKLNARSWQHIGKETNSPKRGDVVVLWRESPKSWKGHVGFFIRETKNWIYVLGGNQSNRVCIKAYPKSRLLSYRDVTINN